jgi:hypothetical protein
MEPVFVRFDSNQKMNMVRHYIQSKWRCLPLNSENKMNIGFVNGVLDILIGK